MSTNSISQILIPSRFFSSGESITTSLRGIYSAIIAFIVYRCFVFIKERKRFIELVEKLPGPTLDNSNKILAHAAEFSKTVGQIPNKPKLPRSIELFYKMSNEYKYDGLFRIWVFNPYIFPFARCGVLITDQNIAKQVLADKTITCKIGKEQRIYKISKPLVGDSFLSMEDSIEWKRHRKIAAMGFHQNFLEYTNETVTKLLYNKVFPKWDKGINNTSNLKVEMVEWATRMTLEVLGIVAFSCSFNSLDNNENNNDNDKDDKNVTTLYDCYQFMLTLIARKSRSPPIIPLFWVKDNITFNKYSKIIDSTIEKIVRERLTEYDNTDTDKTNNNNSDSKDERKYHDLLSYLLSERDDGYRLPYKYLFGNTRMFLFAGHDTTAGILSNALWELAINPRVQKLLQEEVDEAFIKFGNNNNPSYKDIMQLKYLDAVVKEALRKHSSAGVGRVVKEDVTVVNGDKKFIIPKGVAIYDFATVGHNLDNNFHNPKEFYPERFIDEKTSTVSMNQWRPFSLGIRNCVGQPLAIAELKSILVHIMYRYTLKRNSNAHDPIPVITLTVKPHEVLIDLERRIH